MTRDRKRELRESQNYEFIVDADEASARAIELEFKAWIIGKLVLSRSKRIFRNLKNRFWVV